MYVCVHVYACVYVQVSICLYIYTHVYMYTCVYMSLYLCIYMYLENFTVLEKIGKPLDLFLLWTQCSNLEKRTEVRRYAHVC